MITYVQIIYSASFYWCVTSFASGGANNLVALICFFLPLAEQNSKKWEKFQLRSDRRRVSKKASYHIYKCHLSEEKEP